MMIEEFAWELGTLILGGTVTVTMLLVGHWAPWVDRLSRIKSYTYGTFWIWAGVALWRVLNGDWRTAVGSFLIVGAAGATVVLTYRIDRLVKAIRKARKAESVDDEVLTV